MAKLHPKDKLTSDLFDDMAIGHNQVRVLEIYPHHVWPWLLGYFEETDIPRYVTIDDEEISCSYPVDVSIETTNGCVDSPTLELIHKTPRGNHGVWTNATQTQFVKTLLPKLSVTNDLFLMLHPLEGDTLYIGVHFHRHLSSGDLLVYAYVMEGRVMGDISPEGFVNALKRKDCITLNKCHSY